MSSTPKVRIGDLLHGDREAPAIHITNVTESLYDVLWRRLVNLEFEPGARLSDDVLAREFSVSRTPVREALHRLSQVGLVEISARRGFFVTQHTPESLADLFDLRTALESWAVRMATPSITAEDVKPFLPAIDNGQPPIDPEHAESFVRTDLELHFFIANRAGNNHLTRSLRDVNGRLAIAVLRLALSADARVLAQHEHARIVDAMLLGDSHAAATAMEEHIQQVKWRSLDAFRS